MNWGTRLGTSRTAAQDLLDFRLVRWLSEFNSIEFLEGSAQSFKAGQVVYIASGRIVVAADAQTVANGVLGVAVKDASGVQDTPIPVWCFNEEVIFLAKCTGGTPGVANIGVAYELDVTSTVHTVNLAATTQAIFKVVGLPVGYATTTHENYQKVYCVAISGARQMN